MADTLRVLRVELQAGIAGFQKGFKEAADATGKLSGQISKLDTSLMSGLRAVGSVALPVAAGFAAVGGALALAAKQTMDYADAFVDLSTRSGHGIEWLQGAKFAAEQSGVAFEQVTGASEKLRKALGEGSEKTTAAVRALGLSFQELRGLSPDEQMNRVLRALAGVTDATARTTIAMQLMGRGGGAMLAMAGDFDTLRAKAEELGIVMSEKDVRAAEALGDSIDAMGSAFGGLIRSVGAAITSNESLHVLIRGLTEIFGNLARAVNGNRSTMAEFVSGGVILVAKGLIFLADVAQVGLDVWDSLRLTWNTLHLQAINLALGLSKLGLAMAEAFGDKEGAANQREKIRLLEEEKLAVGRNADAIITSNTAKTNVIQGVRQQLVELEKNVEAAAGKEVKLAEGSRGAAGGLLDLSDAADEAAKDAAGLAKTLLDADKAFHAEAMKTWDEWGKGADANIKHITSEYLRISAILGPSLGEVTEQFDDLQASAAQRGGLFKLNDAELKTFISEMERLGDTGKLTSEQWGVLGDAYTEAMQRGIMATGTAATAVKSFGSILSGAIQQLPQVILGAIQGGGNVGQAIGSSLGGNIMSGLIGEDFGGRLGGFLTKHLGDTLGKALGSLAGPLGSLLGAGLGKIFDKLNIGGNKVIMQVNDLRDSFFAAQGGFVALQQKLSAVTNQDLVKKIFDAKTVDEFNAAVAEVNGLLGLQGEAQEKLREATERYGFTLGELGPAMQRQELDAQAAQLLQDFRLLTASGIDTATVLSRMGTSFSEFVQQSLVAGQAIPMAMKPMVDQLIQSGQLLDANGNAFTSAEAAGITFTETLTEGLSRAVTAIEALVAALTGVPPVTIPVNYQVGPAPSYGTPPAGGGENGGEAPGGEIPSFSLGGIGDFGRGSLALLHGREAIIPLDGGGGAGGLGGPTINVYPSFEENPLQTYEARQQLREHTVRTLYREASRDLASAVAAGGA